MRSAVGVGHVLYPGDGGEQLSDKVLTLLAVMDESDGMLNVLESMGHTHSKAYSLQLTRKLCFES